MSPSLHKDGALGTLHDLIGTVHDGICAASRHIAILVEHFNFVISPVIVITALTDPLYMARAGELGAEGFFSKGVTSEELIAAIHALTSGERIHI